MTPASKAKFLTTQIANENKRLRDRQEQEYYDEWLSISSTKTMLSYIEDNIRQNINVGQFNAYITIGNGPNGQNCIPEEDEYLYVKYLNSFGYSCEIQQYNGFVTRTLIIKWVSDENS
jgi:hypothetical protein